MKKLFIIPQCSYGSNDNDTNDGLGEPNEGSGDSGGGEGGASSSGEP
jgi:hypothetical protein